MKKLKELASELKMRPVDLIALLEGEIAPGCDALTELNDQQLQQIEQLLAPEPAAQPTQSDLDAQINRALAAQIVASDRMSAVEGEVIRLVGLYEASGGHEVPTDPTRAALVREVALRTKKRPPQWDGQVLELADQVQVIDGEVIVPAIEIVQTPTTLMDSPEWSEPPLKSAAVPALSSAKEPKP